MALNNFSSISDSLMTVPIIFFCPTMINTVLCAQRGICKTQWNEVQYVQKQGASHQNVHLEQAGTTAIKVHTCVQCTSIYVKEFAPNLFGKDGQIETTSNLVASMSKKLRASSLPALFLLTVINWVKPLLSSTVVLTREVISKRKPQPSHTQPRSSLPTSLCTPTCFHRI